MPFLRLVRLQFVPTFSGLAWSKHLASLPLSESHSRYDLRLFVAAATRCLLAIALRSRWE
jgi:hypothetical protein